MNWQFFESNFESFVGVNFWTVIFAWVNLLLVYVILSKLVFKPIKNMIDTRQKEIDDMYADAEESKVRAAELEGEYERKLSLANEESEEILRTATRKAQLKEEEILREANEQASKTLKRAELEVELEKKRAINEVKNEVSDMALEIAAAVIERDITKSDHEGFIDDFISGIGDGQ